MMEAELANILEKSLKGKRYLIVLDDMWKTEAWDAVRICFPSENNGTENLSLHMDLMGPDESWNLFKSVAFANEALPSEFETIGKKIAEKCHGLPLTIAMVAGLGFGCAVHKKSTRACQGVWGSSQQTGKTVQMGHFRAKSMCYSPQFWGWAQGSSMLWPKNQPEHAREAGDHPRTNKQNGGQTGKTVQTGHFQAKFVCYIPRFLGTAQGPGVLWDENCPGHAREVGDHPSMVRLIFHGHLGGQPGETVRMGHFWAKSMIYSQRFQ
ncbi:hypothetical protein CQW23_06859 [Capsicum baccatum]|uniref:NB-ARC domain-containing protein n=1 Tax=Capsicum baccatum TaxID=33114 RepID=A0A2G2X4K1_CAPBA|nr:hypothetical protein CQW23_06859 [Capsicum baccatum]